MEFLNYNLIKIYICLVYIIPKGGKLQKCLPVMHRISNFTCLFAVPQLPWLSHSCSAVGFDHLVWVYLICTLHTCIEVSIKESNLFNGLSYDTLFILLITCPSLGLF